MSFRAGIQRERYYAPVLRTPVAPQFDKQSDIRMR